MWNYRYIISTQDGLRGLIRRESRIQNPSICIHYVKHATRGHSASRPILSLIMSVMVYGVPSIFSVFIPSVFIEFSLLPRIWQFHAIMGAQKNVALCVGCGVLGLYILRQSNKAFAGSPRFKPLSSATLVQNRMAFLWAPRKVTSPIEANLAEHNLLYTLLDSGLFAADIHD